MASAPENAKPLFYKDIVPLNKDQHGQLHARPTDKAPWLANQHAVPLTVEEFPAAQRHYPIIFSAGGPETVPLGLMGMNEGVNVFVEADGSIKENAYVPAYARRYPFMLAKLHADAKELSLCFDPSSDLIGEFEGGNALFEDGEPSETLKSTLKFCEQFEIAGNKTAAFIAELEKHELLTDGEITVQLEGMDEPFTYRGFRVVNEGKLRDLRGDILRGWNQNGMLPLIYAHLFSLQLVREIFGRQGQLGQMPEPAGNA
ncbi:MAG TPA: SapC family protein [Novosphingobium sp.]|nr:SapC family protein [Novosphingobium sp.]